MEEAKIKERISTTLSFLNEKQSRLYLAAEAKSYGWGGKSKIASISGVNRMLIARGVKELENPELQTSEKRIRKNGAGRKKETDKQEGLVAAIEEIVEPHTVGDPMKILLWTSKSVRNIQESLKKQNYKVSHELIRQLLQNLGYSMQGNKKTKEGGDQPDRDVQFEYINQKSKEFIAEKQPVISVDCKKKELAGNYKNGGREWQPVKNPVEVNVYDFIDKTNGKAAPHGVYDIVQNRGWVSVGISSDTAAFSVATIRSWWENGGKNTYQNAGKLYITADGGGSNGSKNRLWKSELQQLANDTGLEIHVSHLPAGTSRWNKIERRLFSYISINGRGRPSSSLAVIIGLINGTKTKSGLTVKPQLDSNIYQTGIKTDDEAFAKINIERYSFHGEWNYIIAPNRCYNLLTD
ncbi:MAG: ISAzo13 family transposase [Tannerella sp.]|jgi:transposase|nr:ISAzo13 family transposase [Tannerella sp.]